MHIARRCAGDLLLRRRRLLLFTTAKQLFEAESNTAHSQSKRTESRSGGGNAFNKTCARLNTFRRLCPTTQRVRHAAGGLCTSFREAANSTCRGGRCS